MADTKITSLTELTTALTSDILAIIDDPAGTPISKKITLTNLLAVYDSRTSTLTNKTFDANASGNSLSNVDLTADVINVLPNANLDADTAHLTTTQTFTGTKTFTPLTTHTGGIDVVGANVDNIQNLIHDISATGLDIDFAEDQLQTYPTLTGNVTFTTFQNITAGKSKTVRLLADGTDRVCTFPSGIKWVGTAPTSNTHTITASKYAIITFTSFGTTEAEIIGAFALEE